MLLSANLADDTLTDVGYQFYTALENPIGTRTTAGVLNAGDGWFTVSVAKPVEAASVRWSSLLVPAAFAREYFHAPTEGRIAPAGEPEIPFKTLLQRTARACGLNPATLSLELAEAFATWLQARVEEAWIAAPWPGVVLIEQRPLRTPWFAANAYTLGDEVAHEVNGLWTYWTAARNYIPAGREPGYDAGAYWETLSFTDRYVALSQAGQTPIGEVLGAWVRDPRKFAAPTPLGTWLAGGNVYFGGTTGAAPFVQFRRRLPRFTATEYDPARTYTIEECFYLEATGDCYVPLETVSGDSPAVLPDLFERQRVPPTLARFAERATRADWLYDDGQEEKAIIAERSAQKWLQDRLADLTILQAQHAGSYSVG